MTYTLYACTSHPSGLLCIETREEESRHACPGPRLMCGTGSEETDFLLIKPLIPLSASAHLPLGYR